MRIVLASASPRRRELIKKITESFETVPAQIDEAAVERAVISCADTADRTVIGDKVVQELAREKGYHFVSVALPSTVRMVLTSNYVGFTGGLRLIEDIYNTVLGAF